MAPVIFGSGFLGAVELQTRHMHQIYYFGGAIFIRYADRPSAWHDP